MAPNTSPKSDAYRILNREYRSVIGSYEATMSDCTRAEREYYTADMLELQLKKRIAHYQTSLQERARDYQKHCSYVKTLCHRLLARSQELRAQEREADVDEVDLLRYGTMLHEFVRAASQQVQMDRQGLCVRDKATALWDRVERVQDRKDACEGVGRESFENSQRWGEESKKFLGRMKEMMRKGHDGWNDEVRALLEGWLKNIEEMVKTSDEHLDNAECPWFRSEEGDADDDGGSGGDGAKKGKANEGPPVPLSKAKRQSLMNRKKTEEVKSDLERVLERSKICDCPDCEGFWGRVRHRSGKA